MPAAEAAAAGSQIEQPKWAPPIDPSRSPLHRLDDRGFAAVFVLCCALVSRPLAVPCGVAGVLLLADAYRRAGLATSPEAPDDIGFTRFFLGVTLAVYLLTLATGWQVGLLVMVVCGMFVLHCSRNLMIIEKVVPPRGPHRAPDAAGEADESRDSAPLERLEELLREKETVRDEAGIDREPASQALGAVQDLARRVFLLRQHAAIYLEGRRIVDCSALEGELAETRDGLAACPPEEQAVRGRKIASLERILRAARSPSGRVDELQSAVEALDEVLEDTAELLDHEREGTALPDGLGAGLAVARATLDRAEETLESLERREAI